MNHSKMGARIPVNQPIQQIQQILPSNMKGITPIQLPPGNEQDKKRLHRLRIEAKLRILGRI